MTKLYVGNLPYSYTDADLNAQFSSYGTVVSVAIIMERETGRSKGFGFVELEDNAMAQKAIKELNGKEIEGRKVVVSVARPKEDRPRGNFGDRNGGGRNRSTGGGRFNRY